MAHHRPRRPTARLAAPLTPQEQAFIRDLVFYEDEALLAFNKPSGLAVQGGSGVSQDVDRLLAAFTTRKGRKPKLVHRLDRETSGLLLVAKTTPAAAHLSAQFADRRVQKTYRALVGGRVMEAEGLIDIPLVKIQSGGLDLMRPATAEEDQSHQAQTRYRLLRAEAAASLVDVMPTTGRLHQIRVHFSALGHALVGDTKYGGLLMVAGKACPRLMLHAHGLTFTHPSSAQPMTLTVPPPADFDAVVKSVLPGWTDAPHL